MIRGLKFHLALLLMSFYLIAFVADAPTDELQGKAAWSKVTAGKSQILRSFEKPATAYSAGHRGVDFLASPGESVFAPVTASVSFTGFIVDRDVLTLVTAEGILISFEPLKSELRVGDYVIGGDPLGVVALGAHCSNKCLHVGVRVNGEYVNPLRFFAPRPVLLPQAR